MLTKRQARIFVVAVALICGIVISAPPSGDVRGGLFAGIVVLLGGLLAVSHFWKGEDDEDI